MKLAVVVAEGLFSLVRKLLESRGYHLWGDETFLYCDAGMSGTLWN